MEQWKSAKSGGHYRLMNEFGECTLYMRCKTAGVFGANLLLLTEMNLVDWNNTLFNSLLHF